MRLGFAAGKRVRGSVVRGVTYRVGAIFCAGEVDHAIDASEGRTSTTVSMWVEFLFG
jgi:hypothetical protein